MFFAPWRMTGRQATETKAERGFSQSPNNSAISMCMTRPSGAHGCTPQATRGKETRAKAANKQEVCLSCPPPILHTLPAHPHTQLSTADPHTRSTQGPRVPKTTLCFCLPKEARNRADAESATHHISFTKNQVTRLPAPRAGWEVGYMEEDAFGTIAVIGIAGAVPLMK